ncbi:MAG: hypothetical protein WCW44_05155, partial [archaeon]
FHTSASGTEAELDIGTRVGFKGKGIGSKLVGKSNALIIAKGVTKARLSSLADGFYNKTNYRRIMGDGLEMESEIKTYEANFEKEVKKLRERRQATQEVASEPQKSISLSKKKIPVKVSQAGIGAMALLHKDYKSFHIPFDDAAFLSKFGKVYVAIDKKNPELILAYMTVAFAGNKAKIIRVSTRVGYENARIGRQLYGKARAHLQGLGFKRIEVPEAINDAKGFYGKKLHMEEIKGLEKSAFTQELIAHRRARIKKITPPKTLAPQNVINKDLLMRRRFLRGR